ncbi:hypothetical protein ACOSP7_018738 [Xanthoceras sorbifolium]|uniref:Uncharacterized protein n=1 Tax=Xanthoceras sorbifolium TaxID=99658 RepID=A0ABQ8I1M6_9ROSI|nr:hypothetical protein JRO89_XS05G0126900 [Xanthoceras sorbifolium]
MKIKNKGKVYPSPSSSSSSSFSSSSTSTCSNVAGGGGGGDYLSVLTLLPAAIIALASVLPFEDREVLAYLIMRSMKTTVSSASNAAAATNPPSFSQKKPSKKTPNSSSGSTSTAHKAPGLYCDCFDCYTSFWFRWDSSPNREHIHRAIEAFEDHLTSGESEKSKKNGKGKRKDKTTRRLVADNNKQVVDVVPGPGRGRPQTTILEKQVEVTTEESSSSGSTDFVAASFGVLPENEVAPVGSPEKESGPYEENEAADVSNGSSPSEQLMEVVRTSLPAAATSCSTHPKGLARKVLPDVLGLFNSRLWSLWSPNV